MAKSSFFRVFTSGQTVSDGREITPQIIDEMVETFDTNNFTPRINIEHIAGFSPEPPFNGYGSVIALRAQDDQFTIAGKTETRRALYAQIDGNDQLVELRKPENDQKPFPSVELMPNFAGSGKTALGGLAFTDTPAALGAQALKFSRTMPGSVFSVPTEPVAMTFEADEPAQPEGKAFNAFSAFITKLTGLVPGTGSAAPAVVTPPAVVAPEGSANFSTLMSEGFTAMRAAMAEQIAGVTAAIQPIADKVKALETDFAALPMPSRRTLATGEGVGAGSAAHETDC